jgi:hypothetical protein
LFQHFGSASETIARLADRDVQHQLRDAEFPHGVGALVIAFRHCVNGGVNECDRVMCAMLVDEMQLE